MYGKNVRVIIGVAFECTYIITCKGIVALICFTQFQLEYSTSGIIAMIVVHVVYILFKPF